MLRRNREIVIFNLSAIDLFCSGMGAVMVLMVLLMPYYGKKDPVPPPIKAPVVAVTTPAPVPPAPAPPVPPKPITPPPEKGVRVRSIDVVFVMDATASMGKELDSVRSGMTSVVQVLRRLTDDVGVGFVAYTDRAVPWSVPLRAVNRGKVGDENLRLLMVEIGKVELVGNSDWPEDVCAGLGKAVMLGWPAARGDRRQLMVVIGDARTHPEDRERSLGMVRSWVGAAPNRSVNGVFTANPEMDGKFPGEYEESRRYFQDLATVGHGQYIGNQGDMLGSILDILIVR